MLMVRVAGVLYRTVRSGCIYSDSLHLSEYINATSFRFLQGLRAVPAAVES